MFQKKFHFILSQFLFQSLAAVLGAKERGQGYLQGNGYVVSWCVGHLIGLAAADSYDPKYSKWCYEDLPIIPKQW